MFETWNEDDLQFVKVRYEERNYEAIVIQMGEDLEGSLKYARQLRFEKHLPIRQILAAVPKLKQKNRNSFPPLKVEY